MASTRHQPGPESHPPPHSDREGKPRQPASLQPSPIPLDPVPNLHAAAGDCILNPSSGAAHGASPTKGTHRPRSSGAGQARLSAVSLTAPTPPMFPTDSPIKRPTYGISHQRSPSLPLQAAFTTFPSAPSSFQPRFNTIMNNDGFADFPDPTTCQVKSLKRPFMETVPGKDRSSKKQKREEPVVCTLPEPEDMPPVEDDGSKPPCSYATLIGMAILRAPGRKLTLAQIYKWISETFAFYRSGDSGWQNSIRHNLSLNKAFIKQERPKDDPGKGNYWAIEPGMEGQFLKDRPVRRATLASIPLPPILQRDASTFGPAIGTTTWRVPPNPSSSVQVPEISKVDDLSSDATIPASDPALQDDANDDDTRVVASHSNAPRSSPPQVIHSSPPLAPTRFLRQGTPPTPSHSNLTAAVPRSRKRASTAVNDSGYYSSIESSAMRSNKAGHILTSDLDIEPPRIKRGRAEEEIARIRSSSHDISPSHPKILKRDAGSMAGSSPFRDNYVSLLAPPLTPAIKFKKPLKPPPSLSPNTNLRNHRRKIQQMVNSPIKHLDLTDVDFPLSPNFNIHDDTATPNNSLQLHFDIFADATADITSTPIFRSPEKRLLKSSLEDANTFVGSPLADITSNSANKRLSRALDSNGKGLSFQDSPSKMPQSARLSDASNDDFFSFSFFEGGSDEVDGIDLLQGFKKIGGNSKESSVRPTFNHRNHT